MLITPERKVPQRSDASQNNHKRKGYPAKTSAAAMLFTMQKSDMGADIRCFSWIALALVVILRCV